MDLDTLSLSKLCQICQRPASDKETYYNHYGAISCLGCKAFFRRYHRERKKTYYCKHHGNCDVSYKTKIKSCKYCRYKKCVTAGMIDAAVEIKETDSTYVSTREPLQEPHDQVIEEVSNQMIPMENSQDPQFLLPINLNVSQSEIVTDQRQRNSSSNDVLDIIDFTFFLTCVSMKANAGFKDRILSYHKIGNGLLIKEDLFSYVIDLCNQFKHFALSREEFLGLSKYDQRRLFHQNTPIYVQFVLAMYFNAKSGWQQLQILPGIDPISTEVFKYKHVTFAKFQQDLQLFHPNQETINYENLIYDPCFQKVRQDDFPLLAILILFNHDGISFYDNGILISKQSRKIRNMFTMNFDEEKVISTCAKMSKCFSSNVKWSNSQNVLMKFYNPK